MMDLFRAGQHSNIVQQSSQVAFRLRPKRTAPEFQQAARCLFQLVSVRGGHGGNFHFCLLASFSRVCSGRQVEPSDECRRIKEEEFQKYQISLALPPDLNRSIRLAKQRKQLLLPNSPS